MKPRRGLKPPLPSSSRSETVRGFRRSAGGPAAPPPIPPPPAAGADVFAGLDGAGAGRAADAGEAAVVKGVIGDVVGLDVVPDLLLAPVDKGGDLGAGVA